MSLLIPIASFWLSSLAIAEDLYLAMAIKDPKSLGFTLEQPAIDFWAKRFPRHELEKDPYLGISNVKNQVIRSIAVGKGRLIWDVLYDFDEWGRRKTWFDPKTQKDHFIIFSGCSFTFGTGLHFDETIPSYTAQELPNAKVYNAAIGASSTNQMLAMIQHQDFKKSQPEKKGVFVYVYIGDHIGRANGIFPMIYWMGDTPQFENQNGIMVRDGTIRGTHPIRSKTYELIGKTFFSSTIFPGYWNSHYEYVCNMVEQAKKDFEKKYPGSKFVAVEHPLSTVPELTKCLKSRSLNVLSYDHEKTDADIIKGEGHPSASFNKNWSRRLAKDLKPYLN